jgi:hypothetical protein
MLPDVGPRRCEMPENEDYQVGYKKPPRHTQWKRGQSGNPKGRPKQNKDFAKLLDRELSQTITVTEGGQVRTITLRELVITTLVRDAAKGDSTARKYVLGFMISQQTAENFEPDAEDRKSLMELIDRVKLENDGNEEACDE